MTTGAPRRVAVQGELTISTAAGYKQRLMSELQGIGDLQLDLSGVSELDSAGLQVLLLVHREAAARHITVEFFDPSPAVAEVLAVAHLSELEA